MRFLFFICLFTINFFAQDISKPFILRVFTDSEINMYYSSYEQLAQQGSSSDSFVMQIQGIVYYGKNNFNWEQNAKLRLDKQKKYIVNQVYSYISVNDLATSLELNEEQLQYVKRKYREGLKANIPKWDQVHREIWDYFKTPKVKETN